ncbi:MAG TPA: hypothetical protein VIF10_04950, partial [Methylobacter sp.]
MMIYPRVSPVVRPISLCGAVRGKQRLNFATFITKERLKFPATNHYHFDSITYVNFMTGKLSAQSWQRLKAVF